MIGRITYAVLIVGAMATVGFTIYAARPNGSSNWGILIAVATWTLLPYAVVMAVARRLPSNRNSEILLCIAAVLLSGFGIFGLYQSFIVHLDPQSALVLVLLPLWQLLGLLPFLCVSWYLANREAGA